MGGHTGDISGEDLEITSICIPGICYFDINYSASNVRRNASNDTSRENSVYCFEQSAPIDEVVRVYNVTKAERSYNW